MDLPLYIKSSERIKNKTPEQPPASVTLDLVGAGANKAQLTWITLHAWVRLHFEPCPTASGGEEGRPIGKTFWPMD